MSRYNEQKLLALLLDCGTLDIDFLLSTADDFNVDLNDLDLESEKPTCNGLLYQILDKAVDDAEIDRKKHNVSIYTNCLDTHLHIDGEEISDADELELIADKDDEED